MDRQGKGHAVHTHVDDYCVVDLETTEAFVSTAKIIEISVIRVRKGQVVNEYSTLVNPMCHIPSGATAVNHITDDMVKDAPVWDQVIDTFIEFVGNDVVVGYNNAGFDMNIIYDAMLELRGTIFTNNYIDILHSARKCLPELENHRLETVSKHYSLDTTGEHRALKDCYLTKDVYDRLFLDYGDEAFIRRKDSHHTHTTHSHHPRHIHHTPETLALQTLQILLQNIIDDGKVTLEEFNELKIWMADHRDLQVNYPFDRVFNALDKVLEDGKVEPEELDELQVLFSEFVDPVKCRGCHDEICSIYGKHIVVTGDFEYGSRLEVCALIESAGGIIDKGVKKSTDYVVVGMKGSENWKTGNYGSKIQKAMELKDKGSTIEIVEECEFIPAINLIIENGVVEPKCDDIQEDRDQWKYEVRDMLEDLIQEYELPAGSVYMKDNFGQKSTERDVPISYTVCIWEPDYPPIPNEKPGQNKNVLTISSGKGKLHGDELILSVREIQEGDLHMFLPEDAELSPQTKTDKDSGFVKIYIKRSSPNLAEYIRRNAIYCIRGYVSKATRFGCCSKFVQCSDARKCLHENKLYSKACMYRDNLDQGRIFYGKNRNID